MDASSYVALAGQMSLENRMATLAGNIANANTPGFRAGIVDFKSAFAKVGAGNTAFPASSEAIADLSGGGLSKTGNPLDLAVNGDAFFAFQSPQGTYYSRDGRLTLGPDGQLRNLEGHGLLDPSLSPVILDPSAGPAEIDPAGAILQGGAAVGRVGLFEVDLSKGFLRRGSAGLAPTSSEPQPADPAENGVVQGFIEGSNVDAVTEMVNLIRVQRAFEAMSTFADKAMEAERDAINALGAR